MSGRKKRPDPPPKRMRPPPLIQRPSITRPQSVAPKQKKKKKGGIISSLKKVGKTAVKGAKVAKAAGGIVADIHNPYKMGKMIKDAAKGKGLVYPGSKYIGPGNPMDRGKPTSSADAAAYQHDLDYDRLLKKGVKPKKLYLGYSDADKRLMKRSDITTKHGLVTYGGMAVKKGLYKLGLTGKKIKD